MEGAEQEEVENMSPVSSTTEEDTEDDSGSEAPQVVRRKVSFADAFGLDLVSVQEFENIEATLSKVERQVAPAVEEVYVSCVFTVPSSPEELYQKLEAQMIELESIELLPGTTTLRGFIRVVNLCYSKSVFARVTLDDWSSYFDLLADYVPGSSDRKTDSFTFSYTLAPPFEREGTRVEFCLRYETSAGTFWANNNGMNYVIFCHQRGAAREGQENVGGRTGKKSCLKENRRRTTEGRSWTNASEGTAENSTLFLKDQRTLVECRRRRQRAARLAHVKDLLSERGGQKTCNLRALQSQKKLEERSQILTYHQIPLLTLDWRDEAEHTHSAAEPSKVVINDTQSEGYQKRSCCGEETPACDVWREFLNRPSGGDESLALESEWLQMATSVTPSKKSVVGQQLKTEEVDFEGETSEDGLVEPQTESSPGETSAQGECDEGSAENRKLANQEQDLTEANILKSNVNDVTPRHPSNDNDQIRSDDLFLQEVKVVMTCQDEAPTIPRQMEECQICHGSVDENQCAEFRLIQSSESKFGCDENRRLTSENRERAQRESDEATPGYPAVDKHLDVRHGASPRPYFKTKTATEAGVDAIQRIEEKQGDGQVKCEADDKRPGDFKWSGVIQEKQDIQTTQSEVLDKVTNEDVSGSMTLTDLIPKALEGSDTNHGSKGTGTTKVVREESGSLVSGPHDTGMKETFTVAKPDKKFIERFVENVIKGVWDEVFSQIASDKDAGVEQVLKCEAFKSPSTDKCTVKPPEVLEMRWTLSEKEMKSENEDVSRNTSTELQPETLDTSRVVIRTMEGEAEEVRTVGERNNTQVQTKVEDSGDAERLSIKQTAPDTTEAAPGESLMEHFVEILLRGIWEEVFSQTASNLKTTARKGLHQNKDPLPLRCTNVSVRVVQETERNLLTPAVTQSEGENPHNFVTHQHMTDSPNCKQTDRHYIPDKDSGVLSAPALSRHMISASNCDEFSTTDERVTRTGVERDTFSQKLQPHSSLRAHLSQDLNTSLAPRSRQTRNVVGRANMETDTSRGPHELRSSKLIPYSESDKILTTNEAVDDPKLQPESNPIDSSSHDLLGFSPDTQTSSSYKDHPLLRERVIPFQVESAPHHGPPVKGSDECEGLVWWSVLYVLSHVTKLFITGLFVTAFFVFVLIYDFPVFFALYVFSTCWCFYKWRGGPTPADKSSGS